MAHPSFIVALFVITTLITRLAFGWGTDSQPVIFGADIGGMEAKAQGDALTLTDLPDSRDRDGDDSIDRLNRTMVDRGYVKLVIDSKGVHLFRKADSLQSNRTLPLPGIDPSATFTGQPTGFAGIDQTPGVLFLNSTTLDETTRLVMSVEPSPTKEIHPSIGDADGDTLTVIDPVPDQERDDLTRIPADLERESLESSAFTSPTPVPTVRVEGEGPEARVQLEFPHNITVIQPSPTKVNDGSGSKTYTVSYQPRQVGTTSEQGSASHSSSTATGESSKTQPSPTSTASTTSEVAGSSTDSPPPAKRKKLAAVPDSTTEEVEASEPILPREETYNERKARIIAEYMAEKEEERRRLDEHHQKWFQDIIDKKNRRIALQTDPKEIERLTRNKEEFIKEDAEKVRARKEDWAADDYAFDLKRAKLAARTPEEVAMEADARYTLPSIPEPGTVPGRRYNKKFHLNPQRPSKEEAEKKGYVFLPGSKWDGLRRLPGMWHDELRKQGLEPEALAKTLREQEEERSRRRFDKWDEPDHGDKEGWAEYRRYNVLDAFYEVMRRVGSAVIYCDYRRCWRRECDCEKDQPNRQKTDCYTNWIYYQHDDTWVFNPDARCTCGFCNP